MELRSLFVRIKGDTSDIEQKLGRTNSLVDKFKAGVAMGAGFGLFNQAASAISGVSSAALTLTGDYEQTMNLLQASSGASAAEMERLRATAKALGGDISLPGTSAADATAAMLELNKAGLSLNDTMAASKGVLQLSAAAQIDNASAAQITANALNTFGLAGTDATRVADLLAAGANASSASITDLAQGVQQGGFAFKATNQSLDDLVTAVAALTNVGLTGSDGATALKNAMLQLAAPTDAAQATMAQLGINVRDANGQMLPFPALIQHLQDRLEGLSPAQRDMALKTMLQSDGMKAMIPLLDLGADGFNDLKARIEEQGAAAKMAAAQNQGFNGALDGLKSAGESLAIAVLEPLLPLLTDLVTGLATVVSWFSDQLVPGAIAAGAALGVYALATTSAAVGTGNLGLALALAGSQAVTAAAAFAALAIPLAAIAVAVGGPIVVLNHFTDAATEQTARIRENSQAWNDGVSALERYRAAQEQATGAIKEQGAEQAKELDRLIKLRDEKLKRATGDGVVNWIKVGAFDSDDVTQRQIAEIKDLDAQIAALTSQTQSSTTTLEAFNGAQQAGASMAQTVNGIFADLSTAVAETGKAFLVTTEAEEESAKMLERLASAGPQAMATVLESTVSFLRDREAAQAAHEAKLLELTQTGTQDQIDAEQAAYLQQEQAAATSYANQQAAQRAHLGQMLIDWINAQAMVDQRFAEQSGALVQAIATQYGIVADAGSVVWGDQLNAIRHYVDGSIPSLGELMATLNQNEAEAVATQQAMQALADEYIIDLVTKRDKGEITPEEYEKQLRLIPSRVATEIAMQAEQAQAEAARTQAIYDRMDRKIETTIEADGTSAITAANQVGRDIAAGLAAGITANAGMVSSAMQKTAANAYAAAKGYLQIQSPSRRFAEIGRFIDEGLALGVAEHADKPAAAVEQMGETLVNAHARYQDQIATATARFAEDQARIWADYYADLKAQTDAFNSDKFDQQLDFYDRIANLDSADREAAMARQRAAWDVAQQMAQEGRAAEAAEYYDAALKEIEADTQRAEKLKSIAEDLAEKRQQLANETDEQRRAQLQQEINELESREQFLKEVDQQRDDRAAAELARLQQQDSELAQQRDKSLADAQSDYADAASAAEAKFLEAFGTVRDGISGVADSTQDAAAAIVAAYQRITSAAASAAASAQAASSAGPASTPEDGGAVPEVPQGSYALGTGDRGLPDDGLFFGHAREIIANPVQSNALRDLGGLEQAIAKARSYEDLDGQVRRSIVPTREGTAVAIPQSRAGGDFIVQGPVIAQAIIRDELDIEVVASELVRRIKRQMGGR